MRTDKTIFMSSKTPQLRNKIKLVINPTTKLIHILPKKNAKILVDTGKEIERWCNKSGGVKAVFRVPKFVI